MSKGKEQTLGRDYVVIKPLGKGGMGAVVLVKNRFTDHLLAAKQALRKSKDTDTHIRTRVLAEIQSWLALPEHPHLVPIRFFHEIDSNVVIFSDFVDGGSLQDALAPNSNSPSPWANHTEQLTFLLDVAIQSALGLHAAHSAGIVHQDVKPSNIFLGKSKNDRVLVKVGDFGLSRGVRSSADGTVAAAGYTLAYRSPEQVPERKQPVTAATDQWSFGVTLLEAFAGVPRSSPGEVAGKALESFAKESIIPAGRPRMPEGLVPILRRIFQENPEQRYASMLDVAEALRNVYVQATGNDYPDSFRLPDSFVLAKEIVDWPWPDPQEVRHHFNRILNIQARPPIEPPIPEPGAAANDGSVAFALSKPGRTETVTSSPVIGPPTTPITGEETSPSTFVEPWPVVPTQPGATSTMRDALMDLDCIDGIIADVRIRLDISPPGLDIEFAKLLVIRGQILHFLRDSQGSEVCFSEAITLLDDHPLLENSECITHIQWTMGRAQMGLLRSISSTRVQDADRVTKQATLAIVEMTKQQDPAYAYDFALLYRYAGEAMLAGDNNAKSQADHLLTMAIKHLQACKWKERDILRIQAADAYRRCGHINSQSSRPKLAADHFQLALDSIAPILTSQTPSNDASRIVTAEFVAAAVLQAFIIADSFTLQSKVTSAVSWNDMFDQAVARLEHLLSGRHRGLKETLAHLLLQKRDNDLQALALNFAVDTTIRAITLIREAIDGEGRSDLVPKLAEVYVELAKTHEQIGQRKEAFATYERATFLYDLLATEAQTNVQYAAAAFIIGLECLLNARGVWDETRWEQQKNSVIADLQRLDRRTTENFGGLRREIDLLSFVPPPKSVLMASGKTDAS